MINEFYIPSETEPLPHFFLNCVLPILCPDLVLSLCVLLQVS